MKKKKAEIISQKEIAPDIYDMVLSFPEGAREAKPGQFIAMYCNDGTKLLPRPISICGIDGEKEHCGSFIVLQEKERNSFLS